MKRRDRIVSDIGKLIALFAPRCEDRGTIDELCEMLEDDVLWAAANDLFHRIRHKTLDAERAGDRGAEVQYLFEEVCAKTLYNLSYADGSFDADSPYWIAPNALAFARVLHIEESDVIDIVGA